MKFIPRQDRVLLVGLAATLLVVFARPIRYLLDLAYQVEQTSGLALIPGLIILTVVFLFHQQAKRQETKARTAALEADAFQAQLRAGEMERLVMFGQALGRSLDFDARFAMSSRSTCHGRPRRSCAAQRMKTFH